MSHKFAKPHWSNATGQRDRALPVHVRILKFFSEGGEGPAFRPGWVQIKTVENRRGSEPPLPTPSGSAHDAGDNISNQMTTGVMVKNQYEILLSAVFICTICTRVQRARFTNWLFQPCTLPKKSNTT